LFPSLPSVKNPSVRPDFPRAFVSCASGLILEGKNGHSGEEMIGLAG
jgi:hypothetical protein